MKTTQAKIQSYFYCRLVGCMSKETERLCKSVRVRERERTPLVVNQFSFARSFSRLFLEAFFLIATRTNDEDDDEDGEGDGGGDGAGDVELAGISRSSNNGHWLPPSEMN